MQNLGQVASHNTFETSDWTDHLKDVNAIEWDVWPLHNWIVSHDFNVGAGHLEGYIKGLYDWHIAHPNHDLLTVNIEIKSREGWKVGDFESIIRGKPGALRFDSPDVLFRPTDLGVWGRDTKGYYNESLTGLVKAHGWPDITSYKNKVMFVLNGGDHVMDTYFAERPLVDNSTGTWSTAMGVAPICFVMCSLDNQRTSDFIVIWNGEYDQFPTWTGNPGDNLLRRAYRVNIGNEEMVKGNIVPAENAIKAKYINYLAYDKTKNAFWTLLS